MTRSWKETKEIFEAILPTVAAQIDWTDLEDYACIGTCDEYVVLCKMAETDEECVELIHLYFDWMVNNPWAPESEPVTLDTIDLGIDYDAMLDEVCNELVEKHVTADVQIDIFDSADDVDPVAALVTAMGLRRDTTQQQLLQILRRRNRRAASAARANRRVS